MLMGTSTIVHISFTLTDAPDTRFGLPHSSLPQLDRFDEVLAKNIRAAESPDPLFSTAFEVLRTLKMNRGDL